LTVSRIHRIPHPDQEESGLGGIILRLIAGGVIRVAAVIITDFRRGSAVIKDGVPGGSGLFEFKVAGTLPPYRDRA